MQPSWDTEIFGEVTAENGKNGVLALMLRQNIRIYNNGGITEKYTFRFENISFRFTIVEHFVLRIIRKADYPKR